MNQAAVDNFGPIIAQLSLSLNEVQRASSALSQELKNLAQYVNNVDRGAAQKLKELNDKLETLTTTCNACANKVESSASAVES